MFEPGYAGPGSGGLECNCETTETGKRECILHAVQPERNEVVQSINRRFVEAVARLAACQQKLNSTRDRLHRAAARLSSRR